VKLRAMGKEAERFSSHLDKIPNNWTSLYRLAKLKVEDFRGLIEGGKLHAATTTNEINEALGKRSAKAKKGFKAVVDIGAVGEESRQAFAEELVRLVREYHSNLTVPGHAEDLEKLLKASGEAKMAA